MEDEYEINNQFSATKIQCQNCKKTFAKHFILPMYPNHLDLTPSNTYMFCWLCLQAETPSNMMIHPGPWLNNSEQSIAANTLPVPNLNITMNRPWSLQSLDQDYGKDFTPFVWVIATPPSSITSQEGVIQHTWNHQLHRWQRLPMAHISDANKFVTYDLNEFQRLTSKVWKRRAADRTKDHHFLTRAGTYAQTLQLLKDENPDIPDSDLRVRTLKTLNFISHHASASFFHLDAKQREEILTTFIRWETNRIQAGLTGLDAKIHETLNSPASDLFLRQFWTVVLPSLHHHFLCRSPSCKKVVMSHHWATSVKHGHRKQGHYICPSCLATYRPFAGQDHRGNPLLQPKQCLVVKAYGTNLDIDPQFAQRVPDQDRPNIHYYLYLMEWPEEDTDDLINTLKLHTAQLFKEYEEANDRITFLHEAIRDQLRHAQKLPYMTRTEWDPTHLQELANRNQQANFELYRISDLPTFGPPDKKVPFYDWCHYHYTPGVTKILQPKEITKLMALTLCRMLVSHNTEQFLRQPKRQKTTPSTTGS